MIPISMSRTNGQEMGERPSHFNLKASLVACGSEPTILELLPSDYDIIYISAECEVVIIGDAHSKITELQALGMSSNRIEYVTE